MPTTAGVDRFAGFQESPSRKYISKKVAYGHLSAICRSISQVVVEDRVVSCSLVQEPDSTTGSQNLEASHAIDGYVKPVTSTVPSPNSPEEEWEGIVDIAVNCEWMLPESDDEPVLRNGYAIQSRLDAVSAALHEMNNDPRRTHMYSVTIEDEAMCLWYWSRSHSAKSEAVDITKDVRSTIRGLVSFLFASTPELGYDETVQRRFDPALGGYCHIFCVGDSYFKVLRSIAEHVGPCTIAGPSTRVFEVVNVPSFDNITATTESVASPMVLKDVWLDIEAKPEKQIQNTIFGRLQDVAHRLQDGQDLPQLTGLDDAGKELLRNALRDETYRDYFLTIDCDTQGVQSKSLAPGTWREDDVFTFWDSSFWDSSSDRSRSLYVTPPPHRARSFSTWRSFVAKRQYRVVFKEVCQALHRLLFLAGWVHRDISSGNLLWNPNSKRGILSDLEYAKEFNAEGTGSSDPKTGTPAFMASEIISQRLILFSNPDLSSEDQMDAVLKPIIHNFQHDLESFFWLLLWILTTRISTRTPDLVSYTNRLFLVDGLSNLWPGRVTPFRERTIGSEVEDLLPDDMKVFADRIHILNQALCDASIKKHLDFGNVASYVHLYGAVREALNFCVEKSDLVKLAARKGEAVTKILKRKRMDST
ncbi:hypothetical protein BD310DRAFT_818672 [Dichomitus squalens]|uniref:Fungal-type protein kinase domain-containing protein n=1 Tax=Dichomitus squalens TaxID=114155 RepID=A0A4Q9PWE1_9APHY|nr:hypothetical protein BD310DRAFT_818672 [Dichomitus squalens]